jgi:phosphoglycerate dehydrogenase-like enzyme
MSDTKPVRASDAKLRVGGTQPLRVLSHLPLHLLEGVRREFPEVELIFVPMQGELPADVRGEILLTHAKGSPNLAQVVLRGVRWVHTYGTGVDEFPFAALEGRLFTCSRGASAGPISEWVMAVMLAAEKRLPEMWLREPPAHWSIASLGGLEGRTLALLGLGGIGAAVARLARAFGMRVRALRRSDAPSPVPGVDLVRDLDALIAGAHHLVLAAPATRETRRLIDARALRAAGPGLHLVNVARGDLVDFDALRAALDDGRVGLASLDCVTPEPLPAGHWLYAHPRVRVSPHVSWSGPGALEGLLEPFLRNLRRHLAGEPLEGVVDLARGY